MGCERDTWDELIEEGFYKFNITFRRRCSITSEGVVGVTVGLAYWVSLSVWGILRLDLRMEKYAGNRDEEGLPNKFTLLDREVSSSVILVRIGNKSDGDVSIWEGGLLVKSVNGIGDMLVVKHEVQWAEIFGDLKVEMKYLGIVLERESVGIEVKRQCACIPILQLT